MLLAKRIEWDRDIDMYKEESNWKMLPNSLSFFLRASPQLSEFLLLAVPRRLFCFGSLVILDVARCYLWLFTLYINIKISKNSC